MPGKNMTTPRTEPYDPVAEKIRDLVRRQNRTGGWTAEAIAHEMQLLGHTTWSASIVNGLANHRRAIPVDEAVSLLAVFRVRANLVTKAIDEAVEAIEQRSVKGGHA